MMKKGPELTRGALVGHGDEHDECHAGALIDRWGRWPQPGGDEQHETRIGRGLASPSHAARTKRRRTGTGDRVWHGHGPRYWWLERGAWTTGTGSASHTAFWRYCR